MKNRRFFAIILLSVLALLQVRVAFAACEMPASAHEPAGCCTSPALSADNDRAMHEIGAPCPTEQCIEAYGAPRADDRAPLGAHAFVIADRTPAPFSARAVPPALRVSAAPAHAPHTSLVYVLQRLLI